MSTAQTPRGDAPLVVFDFDHTLYDGDSGSHLFAWLIRRSWWRTALALLATPLLGPMVAFLPTRRYGISGYVWIGTVGMPGPRTLEGVIDRYVARHEAQIRARLLPVALEVLHRHREAGDRVVIATGAPPELARAILAFVAHEAVPVIGSQVGPRLGAIVAVRHCHAEEKMRMLRERGYTGIEVAHSDPARTCRCCWPRAGRWWSTPSAAASSASGACRPAPRSSTGAAAAAAAIRWRPRGSLRRAAMRAGVPRTGSRAGKAPSERGCAGRG